MTIKPKVRHVVCTANLGQDVDVARIATMSCGTYNPRAYGRGCGYIKTFLMDSSVMVFPSGKMVSISKSISKAIVQIYNAQFHLIQDEVIQKTEIRSVIRNIVSTLDLGKTIPISKISSRIPGSVYDPESFPAMKLKGAGSCSFLVFPSGKIVINGAKSDSETGTQAVELVQRLKKAMKSF